MGQPGKEKYSTTTSPPLSSNEKTDRVPVLTENEGAKDSDTLAAEADDGSEELSVGAPAGAPPQAVTKAPSVSSIATAIGAAGSQLISFPGFPTMNRF